MSPKRLCACVCHRIYIYAAGPLADQYCSTCTSDYAHECRRERASLVATYPLDPDDTPKRHPGRKDKRRWCGGHVGREHVVSIQIPVNQPGFRGICRPTPEWYRRTRIFRDRDRDEWWWCFHVHACDVCGKHMRSARANECPDRPT